MWAVFAFCFRRLVCVAVIGFAKRHDNYRSFKRGVAFSKSLSIRPAFLQQLSNQNIKQIAARKKIINQAYKNSGVNISIKSTSSTRKKNGTILGSGKWVAHAIGWSILSSVFFT